MSIAERRAAFGALLSAYHNSFENVKEGAVRHSRQFIRRVVMLEAGKQALALDPRLTSTDSGAIAVGIAKHVMTNEKAARSFIDIEIGESGAYVVSFDKDVQPDMAVSLINAAGKSAVMCKAGDHIGEGLISDLLILAVEPSATIAESYIADEKSRVDEDHAEPKEYKFAFWPEKGTEKPRIQWKRMGKNAYVVHDLATAAAKKDYPDSHGHTTHSPQNEGIEMPNIHEASGTKYHTVAVWHGHEGSEMASKMHDMGSAEREEHIKSLVNDHHDPEHEGYADDRHEHPAKGLGSGYRHQEVKHHGETFGMVWNPHHEIAHLYKHMPAKNESATSETRIPHAADQWSEPITAGGETAQYRTWKHQGAHVVFKKEPAQKAGREANMDFGPRIFRAPVHSAEGKTWLSRGKHELPAHEAHVVDMGEAQVVVHHATKPAHDLEGAAQGMGSHGSLNLGHKSIHKFHSMSQANKFHQRAKQLGYGATIHEAHVGTIDKGVWAKAEAAAAKTYGAETQDKNPDKFYAVTMSIYKKMQGVTENAASHMGVRISRIVTNHLKPDSVRHLSKLVAHHGGMIVDAGTNAHGEENLHVHMPSSSHDAFASDWNGHIRDKIGKSSSTSAKSKWAKLSPAMVHESSLEEGLHADVEKSLSHAGMDGSKLYHSPGEGWNALHGALHKHGLTIHHDDQPDDRHDSASYRLRAHQLAKFKDNGVHEPIPGAYIAVARTGGVGDGKGVDQGDMPMRGKHEFVAHLTGKKLKESEMPTVTEAHAAAIHKVVFGEQKIVEGVAPSTCEAKVSYRSVRVHGTPHGHENPNSAWHALVHAHGGSATHAMHRTADGHFDVTFPAQAHNDKYEAGYETFARKAKAHPGVTKVEVMPHADRVGEAKSVPHVKVMYSHPIEGGDINPMLKKIGNHKAVGSHHEFDQARKAWIHHFSFTGKDAHTKANDFGKHISDTLKVPHHVIMAGEIKESASKLDAVMRAFAVPGLREKKTCKFDDIFSAAVGVVRGWPQTSYGVCAESAEKFDELVENVVLALAEHATDEEVSRRVIFEIAQTLVEDVSVEEIGNPDIFADKLAPVIRARLIECGIGHPDVSAALTEICA